MEDGFNNIWHGHVRGWDELSNGMQSMLKGQRPRVAVRTASGREEGLVAVASEGRVRRDVARRNGFRH